MTHSKGLPDLPSKRLPDVVAEAMLKQLKRYEQETIKIAIRNAYEVVRPVEVVDLWDQQEAAITYWILLLTGVNRENEMRIAQDLLTWQAFFAKDSARVLCMQSSEREAFRCCVKAFEVHNFPALLFSDTPEMSSRIHIPSDLLLTLAQQQGGLQQWFAQTHSIIETGKSLAEIQKAMYAESFWKGLAIVYREIKDVLSINLTISA